MPRKANDEARAVARALAAQWPRPTTREIAEQVGADPRTVQRWLGEDNAPRGPRPDPAVDNERLIRMRDVEGLSWAEIAAQTALSATGARNRYRAAKGIPRPDRAPKDVQAGTVTWHDREIDLGAARERQGANAQLIQAALDELDAAREALKARYATPENMTHDHWNDPEVYAEYCEAWGALGAEYRTRMHDTLEEYHMARTASQGGWVPLAGGCYLDAMGGSPWGWL